MWRDHAPPSVRGGGHATSGVRVRVKEPDDRMAGVRDEDSHREISRAADFL
jgi:hypothetical protein